VMQVESLCDGDVLGLSWLFPEAHWTLDARCSAPVRATQLDAACVREAMQEDAQVSLGLLTHVTHALYQRLMRVRLQRLDVYKSGM
jgi:CRP/FNR family transcriptional regulator, cyclic AMP receptor protein